MLRDLVDDAHGDWQAMLRQVGRRVPPDEEAMLTGYGRQTGQARQFCADRELVTLAPDETCSVGPSPAFTRPLLAVASYVAPPPLSSSRTGHFFVPFAPDNASPQQRSERLAGNSYDLMPVITAHETYPGHHHHLSRFAAARPTAVRAIFASTFFTEGWGLYCEKLMADQGFYQNPFQVLRQVESRAFRAARVVVDISLHLGEMTVPEAVDFLQANTLMGPETAKAEVLRYCAWPTQAASYLTGALEIEQLRSDWTRAGHGSLRQFHDTLTDSGRLPLSLVRRHLGL